MPYIGSLLRKRGATPDSTFWFENLGFSALEPCFKGVGLDSSAHKSVFASKGRYAPLVASLHTPRCGELHYAPSGASAHSESVDRLNHGLITQTEGVNTENRPASRSILGVVV